MATVGARLKNDGTLQTAGSFDEVGDVWTGHKITVDHIFADELDEITLPGGAPSGGSILLDGVSQYLSVSGSGDFQFGTDDFTIEGWFYPTSAAYQRLWCFPNGDNIEIMNSQVYYWNGQSAPIGAGLNTINLNAWNHIALVKSTVSGVNNNSPQVTVYINGKNRITDTTPYVSTSSRALAIGGEVGTNDVTGEGAITGKDGYFSGNITQFRVVKGLAVYTSDFSTPIHPLEATQNSGIHISAISGSQTKLLLKMVDLGNLLADSSGTSKSVINVGSATFDAGSPSSTAYNGAMKQRRTGELLVQNEFDEQTGIV